MMKSEWINKGELSCGIQRTARQVRDMINDGTLGAFWLPDQTPTGPPIRARAFPPRVPHVAARIFFASLAQMIAYGGKKNRNIKPERWG